MPACSPHWCIAQGNSRIRLVGLNDVDYHFGELFYHYTTLSAAFEQILPTGKLRFSPYARVNDPLENKPWRLVGQYAIGGAADLERLTAAQHGFGAFDRGTSLVWASASSWR
jgi:hypothetical protein